MESEIAKLQEEYKKVKDDPIKLQEFNKKIEKYKNIISSKVRELNKLDNALQIVPKKQSKCIIVNKTPPKEVKEIKEIKRPTDANTDTVKIKKIEAPPKKTKEMRRNIISNPKQIKIVNSMVVHMPIKKMVTQEPKIKKVNPVYDISQDITKIVKFTYKKIVRWMCPYNIHELPQQDTLNRTYILFLNSIPDDHILCKTNNIIQIKLHVMLEWRRTLVLSYNNSTETVIGTIICARNDPHEYQKK